MLESIKNFFRKNSFDRPVIRPSTFTYDGRVPDYLNDQEKQKENFSNWAFTTSDRIARVVCQAPYDIVKFDSKGAETIEQVSPFYDLIDNPSPDMGRMELWYLTWSAVRWYGNAFWYCPLNKFGKKAQFNFIHPEWGVMQVIKDTKNNILGYELNKGGQKVQEFSKEEIIHFKYPSILGSSYGVSPSMHFQHMLDLDLKMKQHANSSLDNGLFVSKIISAEKGMSEKQQASLLTQLQEKTGAKRAGKIFLAMGSKVTVEDLAASLKDIDYLQALELTKKQIFEANGVPRLDESVNRSVAETGQYVFMLHTIMPDLNMFADFLNRNIIWEYDKTRKISFKNLVPEDGKLKAEVREIQLRSGQKVWNQFRREDGDALYPDGDTPVMTRNVATLEQIMNGDNLGAPETDKKRDVKQDENMTKNTIEDINISIKNEPAKRHMKIIRDKDGKMSEVVEVE